MASIREYIEATLMEPLKRYPTSVQGAILELIALRLEELYAYIQKFPEIVTPDESRLQVVNTIADQFLFTIRNEGDIGEQLRILDNILYVYRKRGSIDTIENMWKYYGGDLPKRVKVNIPSYNLFRYSVSPYSQTHVYQDGTINRSGTYEVILTNNTYDIEKLKEFMMDELVAAGNYVYFTNNIDIGIPEDGIGTLSYRDGAEVLLETTTETSSSTVYSLVGDLVNDSYTETSKYPGYFVLGESKLGEGV